MIGSHDSPIVAAMTRLLAPFLILFAFYVLLHGHESPGGGFQAGVILAAVLILEGIVHGNHSALYQSARQRVVRTAALGVLLYAGIGLACLAGGNFLDYGRLPLGTLEMPVRRWLGILGIEIGVCLGVMASLVLIFDRLTDEERMHG